MRERPPAIGGLIMFRYQELSDSGVPRLPSFIGVRDDVAPPSTLWTTAAPTATGATTVAVSSQTRRFELLDSW